MHLEKMSCWLEAPFSLGQIPRRCSQPSYRIKDPPFKTSVDFNRAAKKALTILQTGAALAKYLYKVLIGSL